LGEHFEGNDLHPVFGRAHVLRGLDLRNTEVDCLLPEIVDADDKHRPAIGLLLPRRGTHQHQRILLP
jgi:hypothetical protein